MEFISSTQTKTVRASGATNLCGSPWKMPRHLLGDEIEARARRRPGAWSGTPEVAPLAIHQKKPRPTKPRSTDTTNVSTLSVQKPPSPIGFGRNVRW